MSERSLRFGTRVRAIGGLLIALALVPLAACTGSSSGATKPPVTRTTASAPFTVTYANEQEFTSYNNNTAGANQGNAVVLNQVLPGFWLSGPQGELTPDTEFGTYQLVTSNPLTVRYTFNPKATWSDGNPIDCDDAVLAWAANSGRWPTGKRDPANGVKLTAFTALNPGAWANVQPPKCADGDRSFTVAYDTVYADWASLFGPGTILPAHIVEQKSGVKDIIAAVRSGNVKTMIKIGNVYDNLWAFRRGQYRTELAPSAGPYQVSSWRAGQSITLKPNPSWWGTPPKASELVIRFIPQDGQVAALRAGKVQVIDPPPSTELVAQLAQAGSKNTVSTHDSFTWEHLDYNFKSAFKSKELRRAFAKCVPRQQIVDNLIKPQNKNAEVIESRFRLPFQPGYDQVKSVGGQAYDTVDVAGAKKILQAQHKLGTTVRLAYKPSPQRKAEVALIRKSCGRAGFKVKDAGTELFFEGALDSGDFDVALYAWTATPLVTQSYASYVTNGSQNKGHYSNPAVDQLFKQLYSEINPKSQLALEARLDSALWSDLATIPLFAYPALLATTGDVGEVKYNPSGWYGVTYNADNWTHTGP